MTYRFISQLYKRLVVLYNTFLVKRECYRNVTAEDILFCTIIVITCFRDVVPPVSDVINVIIQVNF